MENSNHKNKKIFKIFSNTWYDWLINYISKLINKMLLVLKIKLTVFLRQTSRM